MEREPERVRARARTSTFRSNRPWSSNTKSSPKPDVEPKLATYTLPSESTSIPSGAAAPSGSVAKVTARPRSHAAGGGGDESDEQQDSEPMDDSTHEDLLLPGDFLAVERPVEFLLGPREGTMRRAGAPPPERVAAQSVCVRGAGLRALMARPAW